MRSLGALLISFVLAVVGAGNVQAQDEKPWSLSVDNVFVSKYIWRGFKSAGTPSYQPNIAFGYKNLTVSSWSNFAHTAFGDSGFAGNHFTEHNLVVDYGFALNEKVAVNVGWINYAFPNLNDGRYTNEIYGSVGIDTILAPTFAVYADPHAADGMYYNFGIGHGFPIADSGMALNLSASVGYNQRLFIETSTVSDVVLGVSIDIPVAETVTLSPFYNHITGNSSLRRGPDALFFSGPIVGVNLNLSR